MNLKRRKSPILREEIVEARLGCGLQVGVIPKRGFSRKAAIFATRYGSVDLEFSDDGRGRLETPPGVAHFLEHQLFKKAGGQDVLMEFGRYGASSNAFTDYGTTAYFFTASGLFEKSLELLVTFVSTPFFDDAHVAKERLIIEQELRMYDDSPDYRIYKNLMETLYTVHPVRNDIGGSVESIGRIDRDLLERCYRTFYNPANMTLLVAGDVDPEAVFRQVEGLLPPDRFRAKDPAGRTWPTEPPGAGRREIRAEMEISRPRVFVGFKDLATGRKGGLERDLESSVALDLVFGRCGRFYTRAYESGLIDDTFAFSYNSDDSYGFALLGGETDEPERLAEELTGELRRARKRGFRRRDVERSKRKRLGRFIRAFNTPDGAAFLLLGAVQRGIDLFSIPRVISRMTARALEARLEALFDERNHAVSVLTPKAKK